MRSVKVRDYMATRLITFHEGDNVVEAMSVLLDKKISGAPVVDAKGNLVGILSEVDVMAIVIQEMVGMDYGQRYYPQVSGVAQSHNFYPVAPMVGPDGVAAVALGLGTFVVDGGASLRFCPRYPKHILQFSTVQDTLDYSQREFHALELKDEVPPETWREQMGMKELEIEEAHAEKIVEAMRRVRGESD